RETDVPYSTLRRIVVGKGEPDLKTVIAILSVVCHQHQAQTFLAKFYPRSFQAFNQAFHTEERRDDNSRPYHPADSDFDMNIFQMIAQDTSCTKESVTNSFGAFGLERISELIKSNYIGEDALGRLYIIGFEMSDEPEIILKNTKVLARVFNQKNLNSNAALMASMSDSIDSEGLKKIRSYGDIFSQTIRQIVKEHPGSLPVFISRMHNVHDPESYSASSDDNEEAK
ncbi:MAG: hypothetical protein OXC40_05945, partial [Proteobacteria bacterium]|nr:hypothetical protein [Pseudomonadota bacterium]